MHEYRDDDRDPTAESGTIEPVEVIDRRLSAAQLAVFAIVGMLLLIDGFDVQMVSYMAPHIAAEMGLDKVMMGRLLAAAPAGTVLGYLVAAPLAARLGARRALLASTAYFGVLNAICAVAHNVDLLIVLRAMMGVGLGAVLPTALALISEYSPRRHRSSVTVISLCFLSFGFVVAGIVSSWLVPTLGWRSMFWTGALASAVMLPLIMLLPDMPSYLIRQGDAGRQRLLAFLRRIDPRLPQGVAISMPSEPEKLQKVRIRRLFAPQLATGTLLLWTVFFLNSAEAYALHTWFPTILASLDYSPATIVQIVSLIPIGGMVVAPIVGPAMDRAGPYLVLALLYLLGIPVAIFLALSLGAPDVQLMIASFMMGFCVVGGQKCIIAISNLYYPVELRAAGAGFALGIGRLGGVAAPLFVGILLEYGWTSRQVLIQMAAPLAVMAAIVMLIRWNARRVS